MSAVGVCYDGDGFDGVLGGEEEGSEDLECGCQHGGYGGSGLEVEGVDLVHFVRFGFPSFYFFGFGRLEIIGLGLMQYFEIVWGLKESLIYKLREEERG